MQNHTFHIGCIFQCPCESCAYHLLFSFFTFLFSFPYIFVSADERQEHLRMGSNHGTTIF